MLSAQFIQSEVSIGALLDSGIICGLEMSNKVTYVVLGSVMFADYPDFPAPAVLETGKTFAIGRWRWSNG